MRSIIVLALLMGCSAGSDGVRGTADPLSATRGREYPSDALPAAGGVGGGAQSTAVGTGGQDAGAGLSADAGVTPDTAQPEVPVHVPADAYVSIRTWTGPDGGADNTCPPLAPTKNGIGKACKDSSDCTGGTQCYCHDEASVSAIVLPCMCVLSQSKVWPSCPTDCGPGASACIRSDDGKYHSDNLCMCIPNGCASRCK